MRIIRIKNKKLIIGVSSAILLGLSLIGFGYYGIILKNIALKPQKIQAVSLDEVVSSPDGQPDENPFSCDDVSVPATQPKKIIIPNLNINGCIQKVGLDNSNTVAVPTNINVAGYLINSPLPGEAGVSLINGHLQGRYKSAIFKELHKLKDGDEIIIEFGNGTTKSFRVVSMQESDTSSISKIMLSKKSGLTNQLNLITCSGHFDNKTQTYNNRLLVVSSLIE